MKAIRYAIALAAVLAALPQAARACLVSIGAEPPPPAAEAERIAQREWEAQAERQYTSQVLDRYAAAGAVIEVELLDDTQWPRPSRARILAVYKGDFTPGAEIRFQMPMPTNCGNLFGWQPPRGTRGLMQLGGPADLIGFPGFVPPNEVEMLRANRALPEPRR